MQQQYDFDTQAVSAMTNGIVLSPGDKVLRQVIGPSRCRLRQKAVVEKVNPKSVTIKLRFINRATGEVRWETKRVHQSFLYRYNWPEQQS